MTISEEPMSAVDSVEDEDEMDSATDNDNDSGDDGGNDNDDEEVEGEDGEDSEGEDSEHHDESDGSDDEGEETEGTVEEKDDIVVSKKKIGPQKQKKEIHICMKKAKKFEIRKLTRRITMLRNLKGTDEQKAKNIRKVDKLLLEIQEMKDFMIDELTERVVNIFKGTCEQIYLDIWTSAQDKKEFEKLLQQFSNGEDAKKYEHIAFLRMVSSKDILSKLLMVSSGTNIKKPKSEKALKKQKHKALQKYNQKMKNVKRQGKEAKKEEGGESDDTTTTTTTSDNPVEGEQKSVTKLPKDPNKSKSEAKSPKKKKKPKKSKPSGDSFFLQADTTQSDEEAVSSEEEFTAPAAGTNMPAAKKKNRMGQRARKKLLEKEQVKTMTAKSKFRDRNTAPKERRDRKKMRPAMEVKKVVDDEKLHPSWKAKQKLKTQQGISEFSGTKIVFDE